MEKRYWACCMDQNINREPKAVGRQKTWSAKHTNAIPANGIDTVEHTFIECPTWAPERQQAENFIRHVKPTTFAASSSENYGAKDHGKEKRAMNDPGTELTCKANCIWNKTYSLTSEVTP
ncbi:hypothetical protein Trydic_g19583 [Trypoxylus dichotomus]